MLYTQGEKKVYSTWYAGEASQTDTRTDARTDTRTGNPQQPRQKTSSARDGTPRKIRTNRVGRMYEATKTPKHAHTPRREVLQMTR